MGRLKKNQIERGLLDAFDAVADDPLPKQSDLLQAVVYALLAKIRLKDEHRARRLVTLLHHLAAREAYWTTHRLANPTDAIAVHQEQRRMWDSYFEVLREIAIGKDTRSSHAREAVVMQGKVLDRNLKQHPDVRSFRNEVSRMTWIAKHGRALCVEAEVFPCVCGNYIEKTVEITWDDRGLTETLILPAWMKAFLRQSWTPARVRDALLALLHGTTVAEIRQIRKKPGCLNTEAALFGAETREWLGFGLTGLKPFVRSDQ